MWRAARCRRGGRRVRCSGSPGAAVLADLSTRPDLAAALDATSLQPAVWPRSRFRDLDLVAVVDGYQGCWAGVVYRRNRWQRGYLRSGAPDLAPKLMVVLVPAWPGLRGKVEVLVGCLEP